MKIYVESLQETTEASQVPIPQLGGSNSFVSGGKRMAAEITVRVVLERPEDIEEWREQVGQTLEVKPAFTREDV